VQQWGEHLVGLRELCWKNFGNFEANEYSRIISELRRIIGHKLKE